MHKYIYALFNKKIGEVAYRVTLPPDSRFYPVFYVAMLKKCGGVSTAVHSMLHITGLQNQILGGAWVYKAEENY